VVHVRGCGLRPPFCRLEAFGWRCTEDSRPGGRGAGAGAAGGEVPARASASGFGWKHLPGERWCYGRAE
jgi:hypothetical protein